MSAITLKRFVVNQLGVNAFVLHDATGDCVIVDPGCNTGEEFDALLTYIHEHGLKTVAIVNTHGHFDHIFGNARFQSEFGCPVYMHKDDLMLVEHADKYAGIFGFAMDKPPLPAKFLSDGDTFSFGESSLQVLHVPGHSPGSICLYSKPDGFVICGDALFYGSIGRTDLPGGDHAVLIDAIKKKLMTLPRSTVVWPGHGPKTTIGREYDTNPFLT